MRWFNTYRQSQHIGIEFSSHGVLACHLVRTKNIQVKHIETFSPVTFTQLETFEPTLKKIKDALPVSEAPVIVGMNHPTLFSIFPNISPTLKPSEIFRYIEHEIPQWVSCNEPLLWRYQILPVHLLMPEQRTLRVLAGRKSILLQYQTLFRQHGFHLTGMSSIPCAIFRLLRYLSDTNTVAGYFLQDQHHYFCVAHQGYPVYEQKILTPTEKKEIAPALKSIFTAAYPSISIAHHWTNLTTISSEPYKLAQPEKIPETHAIAFGLALLGWT